MRYSRMTHEPSLGHIDLMENNVRRLYLLLSWVNIYDEQSEIRRSRDHAWDLFTSRRHVLKRVYTHDESGSDLLFIGHVAMDLKNGQNVSGEFTGRFEISDPSCDAPKLKSYAIWAVSDKFPLSRLKAQVKIDDP